MNDYLTFKVEPKHIKRSIKAREDAQERGEWFYGRPSVCPVAQAISEKLNSNNVQVLVSDIIVDGTTYYRIHKRLADYIWQADTTADTVMPSTFKVKRVNLK